MEVESVLSIALPVVFIVVGIVLIVALVELVKTLRQARATIDQVHKQLEPTLVHVENLTNALEPKIGRAHV